PHHSAPRGHPDPPRIPSRLPRLRTARNLRYALSCAYHERSLCHGSVRGLYQKRWPGGVGLNLAANFVGSNGFSGPNRSDQAFEAWGRFEWLPTPTAGAVYQIRRQSQDRGAVVPTTGPGAPARHGARTDTQFRLFATSRPHGVGWGGEVALASSTWGADSTLPDQG